MKDRQNTIKAYLQKEQRGKEANRLEREALSDPFLYEALEGLTTVEGNHVQELEVLSRRITKNRIHRDWRIGSYWWIAAACLVIVGVAWKLLYIPEDEPVRLVAVPQLVKDSVENHIELTETVREDSLLMSELDEDSPEFQRQLIVAKVVISEKESTDRMMAKSDLRKGNVDTGQVVFKSPVKLKKETRPVVPDSGVILLKSYKTTSFLRKAEIAKIRGAETFEDRNDWYVAFKRYVADSLSYPEEAAIEGVEGEVVLSLNFNRKGKLGRIKIIRKLHPACDREAVRLVKEYSGFWGTNEKNVVISLPFYLKRD